VALGRPDEEQYRYDPEKASRSSRTRGTPTADGDGVREDAKGKKLEFRFCAMNEYPEDQAAAKLVVDWCKNVGIKVNYEPKDEDAFSDEAYDNGNDDMFIWSWRGDIDPGFMLSTLTTQQILNWGDTNYSNPSYDALYDGRRRRWTPRPDGHHRAQADHLGDAEDPLPRHSYILLWYNVNLQAFRTDKWTGYATVPRENGAPFFNLTRTTYQQLEPQGGDDGGCRGVERWVWALVAGVVVVVAVAGVLVMRRRARRSGVGPGSAAAPCAQALAGERKVTPARGRCRPPAGPAPGPRAALCRCRRTGPAPRRPADTC